ncbi:MAG: hypothetical protein AAB588_05095 [Patescibacteria group bacterium]
MANTDQNQINPETQKILNQPLQKKAGLSAEDQAFLNLVVDRVDRGEIKLLQPDTLINHAIYDALPEEQKGKVDFDAVNLASTLRNIYDLWKAEPIATFQIENMVRQARLTKERFEEISGDVYVI